MSHLSFRARPKYFGRLVLVIDGDLDCDIDDPDSRLSPN